MITTEDVIPIVKKTIAASIKRNTHRGYIGWSSCDNICMDMYDCLDMCAETLKMQDEALGLIIKEAKKKVFDGWIDWRYDLLKCGICLCDDVWYTIWLEKEN